MRPAEHLLPDLAYHRRSTSAAQDLTETSLKSLREQALDTLVPILRVTCRNKDLNDPAAIEELIRLYTTLIKQEKSEEYRTNFQSVLTLLMDYRNILNLRFIQIPEEDGSTLPYCQLSESAGGVTEKIALVSLATVQQQLTTLSHASTRPADIAHYLSHRATYKLNTEAIIKLPKHGNVTEVQREAIALNISRALGFETTRSTMIEYLGAPALFVPFDTIQLMSDVTKGQTLHSRLGSWGKTYLHYSTIAPVGEGLAPEHAIQDLGGLLAFFYLCSDTDAFGGYNQNKAIKQGKTFFIFDQVMQLRDKFIIDSRLSLQPSAFFTRHTRHDQGRNRTLVEDSAFEAKFDSVVALAQRKPQLLTVLNKQAADYQLTIDALEKIKSKTSEQKKQLKTLKTLLSDLNKTKRTLEKRIDSLFDKLPKFNNKKMHAGLQEQELNIIKHALMLEKVLNNPVLFSDDGRPYRHPWTYRNTLNIKNITTNADGKVAIQLNGKANPALLRQLMYRLSLHSLEISKNLKEIRLSPADLLKITDSANLPEQTNHFDPHASYLNFTEIDLLAEAYPKNDWKKLKPNLEDLFHHSTGPYPLAIITEALQKMTRLLDGALSNTKNKGFIMHLQKKVQLYIQQRLHLLCPLKYRDRLTHAFEAAAQLDRLKLFNEAVMTAFIHGKQNTPEFQQLLTETIDAAHLADNHTTEVSESLRLRTTLSYELTSLSTHPSVELDEDTPTTSDHLFSARHSPVFDPDEEDHDGKGEGEIKSGGDDSKEIPQDLTEDSPPDEGATRPKTH